MSSTDRPSGPPGPPSGPPGPPPAPGAAAPQDVTRYARFLGSIGVRAAEADMHEEERLRVGPWRFYYTGMPTNRANAAAIDDADRAVALKHLTQWNALLSEPSLDAAGAHERIGWLYGNAAPVGPSYTFRDPAARQRVKAPSLERSASGDVTFTGWYVFPPQMQVPYRLIVRAPKSGPATLDLVEWTKVSP